MASVVAWRFDMKRILIVALPALAVLVAVGLGLYFFRTQTLGFEPGLKVTDEQVGEATA